MKIIIHRGSSEIGGTCIELVAKKTKLLIDVGAPLNPNSRELDISSIKPDAVIISHPHQDHYGLIGSIGRDVPVYIGEPGRKFIDATGIFLERKLLNNNFKYYKSWKIFRIGDFTITPFLVDHSSIDAHAFLIEAEGKRLFYSGDFRAHGRKSKLFEIITKKPPKNIDVLFMEGTLLGRNDDELPDEKMIESEILKILEEEPTPCFFICSSQNIDRLVSAYKASKDTGRIFVVDIYTAWILKELSQYSERTPNINWSDVRVLSKGRTASRHYKIVKENQEYFKDFRKELYKKDNMITHEEIAEKPQKYFIKANYYNVKYLTQEF
ncbi:MBL fold metallo-hydrolase, partial [candidate division KSB1 bacterium]